MIASQVPLFKDIRRKVIKVQQKLIPDLIDKMYRRFYILSTISQNQPGRRSLSEHMDMTERVLRSETDMLKKQEFVSNLREWKLLMKVLKY